MDLDFNNGSANRGTGFSFYNQNTGKWSPRPSSRIEPNTATGWPNIGFSGGRQFSISHTKTAQGMMFCYRTGNQNEWTEVIVGELVNDYSGIWARAATDGPNIYAIIISSSFYTDPFGDIPKVLHVIRSTDNGNNWESMGGLEENYFDTYPINMSADAYQIDAANGIVSVIYASYLTQMTLYKSMDKAESWTKTAVYKTSNPLIENLGDDENKDFTVDPHFGSDGGNSVIIDSEGISHVVYSAHISYNLKDHDVVNSAQFHPPLDWVSALFYWNENMTEPQMIGKTIMNDNNGDGNLGNFLNTVLLKSQPYYSNSICHPQLGIDANDNLYLSYTALVDGDFVPAEVEFESSEDGGETTIISTQQFEENSLLYTDVFMMKSTDKGASWQGPLNVTKAAASEETYPSIARNIKDTIFLAYQHDVLPGTYIQSSQTATTLNEIAVVKILPEAINNEAAAPDSEPYLSVFTRNYIVPQNCGLNNDTYLNANSWGMDYPEGLLEEIKLAGAVDYSTPGIYTEVLYVEDSAGNQSDTVQVTVEVVPDEQAPLIEIEEACLAFSVVAGSDWEVPPIKITDLVELNGAIVDSGCDVSENIRIESNVNTEITGSYTVIYFVGDFAGNENSLTLDIEVIEEDTEGPQITVTGLPELIGLFDPFNPDDVKVAALDNADCENVTIVTEGLEAINLEELGVYPVTVTATDQSGNSTIEELTVTVVDNLPPVLELIGNYIIEIADPADCGEDGRFDLNEDPGIYISDGTGGSIAGTVEAVYNNGEPINCTCGSSENELYTIRYNYIYTLADSTTNTATAERQISVVCVGIEDNPIYEFVDIFPNPTKGQIFVKTEGLKVSEIKVYNIIGKTILQLRENELNAINRFDLNNEVEGMYMINVITDKGTITRKIHVLRN